MLLLRDSSCHTPSSLLFQHFRNFSLSNLTLICPNFADWSFQYSNRSIRSESNLHHHVFLILKTILVAYHQFHSQSCFMCSPPTGSSRSDASAACSLIHLEHNCPVSTAIIILLIFLARVFVPFGYVDMNFDCSWKIFKHTSGGKGFCGEWDVCPCHHWPGEPTAFEAFFNLYAVQWVLVP